MTRKESLDILDRLNKKLDSMTDDELYDHLVKTSPSFRKTLKDLDDFCKEEEIRELMDWMTHHYGMGNKIYFTSQFKDEESLHKFAESIYDKCMNERKNEFKLAEEVKMEDKVFDENGNYKFNWEPKHTPTDVSTTGGSPMNYGIDWVHHDSQTAEGSSSKTYNGHIPGLADSMKDWEEPRESSKIEIIRSSDEDGNKLHFKKTDDIDLGIIDGDRVKPTPKMEDLKSNFHNPFKPDGNWTADNKTDEANLDAIDNKTSPGPRGKEKIVPIEIKIEPISPCDFDEDDEDDYEDETDVGKKDEKFNTIYLNGDTYNKIIEALNDYKSLIHSDICRLASYHYSNSKELLELAEKLVKAEDTLNLVRDTFRPDRAHAVLDDAHNAADADFLMEQLEKAMQVPENKAKIWNAMLSANVYKKDITAEKEGEEN